MRPPLSRRLPLSDALDALWRDARYALRSIRRAPGHALVTVILLGIGIGASTALFTIVNSVVLRPLPVHEPNRVATLTTRSAVASGWIQGWEHDVWDEVRAQASASFDGVLALSGFTERFDLAGHGETRPVDGIFASGDFFSTLGVRAHIGRTFTTADDVAGSGAEGPVAVISHGFWQRHFGGSGAVIGTPLLVDRVPFTIVGVTPPGFFGVHVGRRFDVALPMATAALVHENRGDAFDPASNYLAVMVRLKPGQSAEQGSEILRTLQPRIFDAIGGGHPREDMAESRGDPFTLVAAATPGGAALRSEFDHTLFTVLAIITAVLLVACSNLGTLALARGAARHHETSVKRALGAGGWRLAREHLVEGTLLAAAGAGVGLLVATAAGRALVAQISMFGAPVALDLPLDWRVLLFAASVTAITAGILGGMPAWRVTRVRALEALTTQPAMGRVFLAPALGRAAGPAALIVVQIGLSLTLLVGAGLFVRTFERLSRVPLGFDSEPILLAEVNTSTALANGTDRLLLYERLTERIARVPGVERAAASPMTPFSWGPMPVAPIRIIGGAASDRGEWPSVQLVTPGWFATYGRSVHTGRDITPADGAGTPGVVVVNDAFVRRFLQHRVPIGTSLILGEDPANARTRSIVGVVGDAVHFGQRGGALPTIYVPLAQMPRESLPSGITITVRAASRTPAALTATVSAALIEAAPDATFTMRTMSDLVRMGVARERLVALLSLAFSAAALVITIVGLYGVTACLVAERRGDIGIRMALGASGLDIVRMVLGRTLALTAAGVVLGLAGAAAGTRFVEALLFEVSPMDPATFAGMAFLVAAAATLAAFVPARHALRADPAAILRSE